MGINWQLISGLSTTAAILLMVANSLLYVSIKNDYGNSFKLTGVYTLSFVWFVVAIVANILIAGVGMIGAAMMLLALIALLSILATEAERPAEREQPEFIRRPTINQLPLQNTDNQKQVVNYPTGKRETVRSGKKIKPVKRVGRVVANREREVVR